MNILTVGVVTEDLMRELECAGPFFLAESGHGQNFEHVQVLLVVIRPLFFDPLFIAAAHELASVEFYRGFVADDAALLLSSAAGRIAFGHEAVELSNVN